jgi:hypothetical protein
VTPDPQGDPRREAFAELLATRLDRSGDPGAAVEPEDTADPLVEGITAALASPAVWSEPPDLRAAVLARVGAEAGAGAAPETGPGSVTGPGHATSDAPESRPSRPEPALAPVVPMRSRRRRLLLALPVAAAGAAIYTLGILGVQQALEPGPDATFVALGEGGVRAEVEVTSAPSGFEITVESDSLPAAPAGSYYAAWLRRGPGPDDVVPIGTFHGRRVGDPIVLWSGVDPAEYRTFSITLQRDGEPPVPNAPSARRVLVGTVDD